MAQPLADRCAACAIGHYRRALPSNNGGKPQPGREWTVYAAVVACRRGENALDAGGRADPDSDLWVVSCATGSKCTSVRSTVQTFPSPKTARDKGCCGEGSKKRARQDAKTSKRRREQVDLDEDTICQCYNGLVLKDSHAETLARRGLVACLWEEIECSLKQIATSIPDEAERTPRETAGTRRLLERCPALEGEARASTTFRLKRDISLHMYVSDSPCGDCAIYDIQQSAGASKEGEVEVNFTGAKLILSGDQGQNSVASILTSSSDKTQSAITLGREDVQQLGALRIKSSRSNIPPEMRTTSMSCSDKLVRWGVFGMQGSLLSSYIPEPICLSSICVSSDPRSVDAGACGGQLVALERALSTRIGKALGLQPSLGLCHPTVAVVEQAFDCSKSAAECRYLEAQAEQRKRLDNSSRKRQKTEDGNALASRDGGVQNNDDHHSGRCPAKKESASGMSLNWRQQETIERDAKKATEITIGATGLKRGKKPKAPLDALQSASRLCRFHLLQCYQRCKAIEKGAHSSPQTAETVSYMQFKRRWGLVREEDSFKGPLKGWVRSGKDDDFMLPKSS